MEETPDQLIVAVAAPNAGVCTRAKLLDAGVSDGIIQRRLGNQSLDHAMSGIYVVESLRNTATPHHLAMAASPQAVLSHHTAASIHGFPRNRPPQDNQHHLLVPKSRRVQPPGFEVQETRLWFADDFTEVDGLRVTSAARTICDLAMTLEHDRLQHLIETQLFVRNPKPDCLVACFERLAGKGRAGSTLLAEVLNETIDGQPFSESKLEQILFDGLAERGCVDLVRQFKPPWYDGIRGIVDVADPIGQTIIEADGRRHHTTTEAMEEDRRRDRLATLYGYATLRVGWRELKNRPSTFDDIIEVVESRRRLAQT